jgi:predicted porin
MNKTVIALALLALGGAALAQSSVTLYGRLNASAEQQDFNGRKLKVLQNNASRIGFKGSEDLGGGLRAGFQLEHGFNVDTGTQSQTQFWARQSEVNLSGGFGMLRLGNFTSEAYYATADYISMHNHDTGTSSDALYAYLTRNRNKIAYRTPEFVKGLTMEAAVLAGEGQGPRQWEAALNYGNGPLHVGLGYEKSSDANQFAASVLYEFGAFVVGALVQRDEDGWGPGLGTRTSYRGSFAYNFGSNELHLNVGRAGDYSRVADSDATQWTVGYNYNLSKRTKAFAFYTKLNDGAANIYGSNVFGIATTGRKTDFSSLAVGVRHNF